MDIKPSDYTLKDNSILEYISCRFSDRERIFKCPVGSTVSQSHATRFRACQGHVSENICWAQWIAKGALVHTIPAKPHLSSLTCFYFCF